MKFTDFGLAEPIVRAVTREGYSVATPIQAQAIPVVMTGQDVIGIAQTGTGKTAAFALPILHRLTSDRKTVPASGATRSPRRIRVLILASTRELAIQIHDSFANYGAFAAVKVAVIYGGVGQQPQVNALRHGVDVVVATPGRLLDLMQQGFVKFDGLQTLVLDEADRMLDMGFFPAIRRILEKLPKVRQTLLFSATMKPEIRDLAGSILRDPVSISIVPKQKTTELVEQSVCFVPQKQKTKLLIELIGRCRPGRAIVFSRTKHGADRIVRNLSAAGLRAEAIHANKSQNKRQRILEDFKGSDPPILVATDIAARGIDVDNVTHVFNHDMPTEEETYVHRIGRSGRAGATGVAISLCDPEERRMLRSIEKLIGMSIAVDQVEGFEIPAADETSAPAAPIHPDPRHPSNRRGDQRHSRRAGASSQREGQRRPASRREGPAAARTTEQRSAHRTEASARGRQHQRSGASQSIAGRDRSSSAGSRPNAGHSPRPVSRSESQDSFGDGVYADDSSPMPTGSGSQPRRRRRRRPARSSGL